MHRSESYDRVDCLQCGADISITKDRAYAVSDAAALCFECAVKRGGRHDELHDVWSEPPQLDGLPTPDDAGRSRSWR
jgi:hypothetical protein